MSPTKIAVRPGSTALSYPNTVPTPGTGDPVDAWAAMTPAQRRMFPRRARLVVTPEINLLAWGLPSMTSRGGIIVVSGPAGSGKSVAAQAIATVSPVRTVSVELSPRTKSKAFWHDIASAISGAPPQHTEKQLRDLVRTQLHTEPTLLIVDEAQNVGMPSLLQLRWLCGLNIPGFALLLAGVGLDSYIQREPQLASRVDRRVILERVPIGALSPYLRRYHPLVEEMPDDLLERIDTTYANGLWRHWSKLLFTLDNDLHITSGVTADQARAAIQAITGCSPW